MDASDGEQSVALLRQLSSGDGVHAWREFLEAYGPVLQQVVHLLETDKDAAADCFLFVCEQLARDRFRRLRQFRPKGAASFSTWLRSVARNLSIDWHRKTHGRVRNGVYREQPKFESLPVGDAVVSERLHDPHPDPETSAAEKERSAALQEILYGLPAPDRLLIQLRYEQDLTLEQVARLAGLKDAQTVDRRIRQILESMRQLLPAPRGKFRPSSV